MKQGRATVDVVADTKVEPTPHAVDICSVADIGNAQCCGGSSKPLYEGRGYSAPMAGSDIHKTGSQGKH
jgi:hypothetical protein